MSATRKFTLAPQSTNTAAALPPAAAKVEAQTPTRPDPIATAMDQATASVPRLLTPQVVAEVLGVTERTLERWRITGEGPRYSKLTRSTVRYLPADVEAFVAERLRANTAQ